MVAVTMNPMSAILAFLALSTQALALPTVTYPAKNSTGVSTGSNPEFCHFCLADDVSQVASTAISSHDQATMAQAITTIQNKIDSIPSGLRVGIPVHPVNLTTVTKRDDGDQGCDFCIFSDIGDAIEGLFDSDKKRSTPSIADLTSTLQNIEQMASGSITTEEQNILNKLKNITTVKRDDGQQGCDFCIFSDIGDAIEGLFDSDKKRSTPTAADLENALNTIKGKISGLLSTVEGAVKREESQSGCAFCIADEVGEVIGSLFEGVDKRSTPTVEAMTGALSDIFGIVNGTVTGPQLSAINYYKNSAKL